ncbi:MAG: hypothetical protein A2283_14530 [Lentisphaerae bacterium RIFOXYA12_FULL_48_11]|nr:MAG: hypothetical protein A2283_14530 [Lentisphaerae bacterium RIFOXYA12_FULL_48_11]
MKMNAEQTRWYRRYKTALHKHLEQGSGANMQLTLSLGCQAAALGVKTLNLALMHEQALMNFLSNRRSSSARSKMIARAKDFFTATIIPIEGKHRAALKAYVQVNQLARKLRQRTAESSVSTKNLKRGIARRKMAETALKKSGRKHSTLLTEAHRLQKHLRNLTREIISAQEKERKKISLRLHDEIAQTMLAINLRLLMVKNMANANTENLKKEIANTQHLVRKYNNNIKQQVDQ